MPTPPSAGEPFADDPFASARPVEITVERGAGNELRNAFLLAVSVVLVAFAGKAVLPESEAARLVFVVAVVGYVAVVRLRLRRDRIRSTVDVRSDAQELSQPHPTRP